MDFQFTPESEHNPEESLSGIVHTPGVTDFSSPHTLGEGAPLKPGIEGGALEGMGGPAKPTLHTGELGVSYPSIAEEGFTKQGTTSEGHSVYYDYDKIGNPLKAQIYTGDTQPKEYKPDEVNFPSLNEPPHPLAQLAPTKPVLHTGELEPAMGIGGSLKADTPDGGKIYYNYSGGKPFSANVYNAGGEWTATHYPDSIAFPPAPKAEAKPEFEDIHVPGESITGSHSTQFAHYKNFDDDKPEFEFAEPVKQMGKLTAYTKLENGNNIQFLYHPSGKPFKAEELASNGDIIKSWLPEDINFPQHPLEQVPWEAEKPSVTLPKVSIGPKWTPDPNKQTLHVIGSDPTIFTGNEGNLVNMYKTPSGEQVSFIYNKNTLEPIEALGPKTLTEGAPGLSPNKVNIPPAQEKPIEELYKPKEDSSYPKAQFSAPLSRDEIDSIREYTGSYYSDINHYVRNKSNLDEGNFVRSEIHEGHMANLDSAIAKASLPEPVTLYRGISGNLFSKFASRLEPGETILHQNYMSTSSRHDFAQQWKSGHTMILETPAGTHALPVEEHSQNFGEKEIIFPRDTRLKLVKKDSKSLYFEVLP